MWLVPAFSPLANLAARVYYRLTIVGERVPSKGPVLLVANHPNSLIDPMLVCAAAGRAVRFLAKAPLFSDPKTALLVRAVGAIPVYRRVDDPALMDRNTDMFREVYAALGAGAAVGIFPEGHSHSEPSLTALKTGAARIALGTWDEHHTIVPVVPIGLVFRQKDVFRSQGLVVVGAPVEWEDLAGRGAADQDAVRELTERIGAALKRVTVNLETWEDRPLVECAVRIWETELVTGLGGLVDPAARVQRLETTTRLLADLRREPDPKWTRLVRDVRDHCRRLARLRLTPASLTTSSEVAAALKWTARRFHLLAPFGVALAVTGLVLFYLPYRVTGAIVDRMKRDEDERSTWKLLLGMVIYATWVAALAAVVGLAWGGLIAVVAAAAIPAVGMSGLVVRERWRGAWRDAQRFFLLRSRRGLVVTLRDQQRALAERLKMLYEDRIMQAEV